MLAGVVVATKLGVVRDRFYLAVYMIMNIASFAVIVARERETGLGDSIDAVAGLAASSRGCVADDDLMLGLAGIPATAGFIGKFYLIDAAVSGSYTWLGVAIVVGSMISLGYYLPVIAAMWMRPRPSVRRRGAPSASRARAAAALAGGSEELEPHAPSAANGSAVARQRVGLSRRSPCRSARRRRHDRLRHHPSAAVRPRAPGRQRSRRVSLAPCRGARRPSRHRRRAVSRR